MPFAIHSSSRRRRNVVAAASVIALGAAMVACSPQDGQVAPDSAAPLPVAEGTTAYPLTLTTAWGESVLDERPERIVAVSASDAELLGALGVTPVGVDSIVLSSDFGIGWINDALPGEVTDPVIIDDWPNLPYEAIAAMKPDLIVVGSVPLDDSFDALAAIAPVVGATKAETFEVDWRDTIEDIGSALDLRDAAAEVTAENERLYTDAAAAHPEFSGKTVSVIGYWKDDGTTAVLAPARSTTEQIFLRLGFAAHPSAELFVNDDGVSRELYSTVDADAMIVGAMMESTEGLTDNPLFQALGASQRDAVIEIIDHPDGTSTLDGVHLDYSLARALQFSGPIAEKFVVESLLGPLSTALKN